MNYESKFWKNSYDAGLEDIDPKMWETTYTDAVKGVFEEFSGKSALTFMGVEVTFAELDRYANRFANMLISCGLQKGDAVGINLPNIPEYVIAWLGALRAGCAVSGVSPLLSAQEMEHQLKDCRAKGLVTLDAIFAARITKIASALPDLKIIVTASVGGFLPVIKRTLGTWLKKIPSGKVTPLEGKMIFLFPEVIKKGKYRDTDPGVKVTPDDIAYIQYTGGTTGPPKGAMLSHRNAVSDIIISQTWVGWEKGNGLALSAFPLFHMAGLFFCENCVYLGWTQVLIANPRDTDHICAEIAKYKPTMIANVPSLYQMLIANRKFSKLDHTNLKVCISAAAPFPEESQKVLEDIVGEGKLLEVYGMSETSPLTTGNPCKGKKKFGSIGLPLLNTDVKLVDPTTGKIVPVGQPGEICTRGPQIMVGYFNKAEETKHVMDADGYLHTGDVAIMDEEGYLRIVDRTKDMIIVGGYKVFSKKVEDILNEHPAIGMLAIIGVPNQERPGSELVVAYMTQSPGYQFNGDETAMKKDILSFARDKLAPFEVPKRIEIMKELPMTTVGKIDKKQLRASSKIG
jgi:long-chain acyl-CoA synthetase